MGYQNPHQTTKTQEVQETIYNMLTNMLEELDCKDVQVMKSIRLGNGVQDTTNTGSSSTEPKPRQ